MDAAEFKQRFLALNVKLYATAWRLTHNAQDAEDLVQDAYGKLWSRRNDLGNIVNVEAYCVRLIKNLHCDNCRRAAEREWDIGPPDELQLPDEDDVQQRVERDETCQILHGIIGRLPENQRTIIVRRDLRDEDFGHIAQTLGMAEGSVRVLLSRARRKVKEQLINWMNNEQRTD